MRSESTNTDQRKPRTLGTIIFMAVIGLFATFMFTSSWIDTLGQQWVECEVTSAHAVQGNNRSVTPWRVEIQTSDCGSISYLKPFTKEKAHSFASEVRPGMVYEFKLGVLSRMALKSPIKVITPSAKEVRRVGSSNN